MTLKDKFTQFTDRVKDQRKKERESGYKIKIGHAMWQACPMEELDIRDTSVEDVLNLYDQKVEDFKNTKGGPNGLESIAVTIITPDTSNIKSRTIEFGQTATKTELGSVAHGSLEEAIASVREIIKSAATAAKAEIPTQNVKTGLSTAVKTVVKAAINKGV